MLIEQTFAAIQDMAAWELMAQYLAPEDIARLQIVCKTFNIGFHSPKFDVLWQSFLNELHSIDNKISVTPQPGQSIQGAFIEGITKVKERFKAELSFLSRCKIFHEDRYPNICKVIEDPKATLNLSDLKKLNIELDDRNLLTIEQQIELLFFFGNNLNLNFIHTALTRFSGKIIDNPKYNIYFSQVRSIDFNNGCLLQELPSNIGKIQNLRSINLAGNRLQALPPSITNLPQLRNLVVTDNQLTDLPPALVEKFGEEWAKQTLATQKPAPVLNQFKRQSEGSEPAAKRQKQRVGQREMAFISNNETLVALRKARTTLENHPKRVKIK